MSPLADILSLRLASRSWNNLIVHHESLIVQHHLQNNPLPPSVTRLYPPPCWADLKLNYVAGLRYRFSVCSKLAASITNDCEPNMQGFLKLTRRLGSFDEFLQRQVLMMHRSTTLLFVIWHFLESYRGALHDFAALCIREPESPLVPVQSGGTGSPNDSEAETRVTINREIQRQIFSFYDDDLLVDMTRLFEFVKAIIASHIREFGGTDSLPHNNASVVPPMYDEVEVATVCVLDGLPRVFQIYTMPKKVCKLAAGVNVRSELTINYSTLAEKTQMWGWKTVWTMIEKFVRRSGRSKRPEEDPEPGQRNEMILKSSLSSGPPGQREGDRIPPEEMREMLRWFPRARYEICSMFAAQDVLTERGCFREIERLGFVLEFNARQKKLDKATQTLANVAEL